MCLLNCILISIVTLTHSAPAPQDAQSTQKSFSSAIAEHPKYHDTLLSSAVVPFISECQTKTPLSNKQKFLCGSYIEMIKKLDASNADGLTTLEDFAKAMSVYNQTTVADFCAKFTEYIPTDEKLYPESLKLNNYASKRCPVLCIDDTDFDNDVVRPICRVFAIGFQLSASKPSDPVNNSTIKQLPAEVNPNLKIEQSNSRVISDSRQSKSESPIEGVKPRLLNQDTPVGAAAMPVAAAAAVAFNNAPDVEKDVKGIPKEDASPNADAHPIAESAPDGSSLNIANGETAPKTIAPPNVENNNQTPTIKQEVKPTGKLLDPSESPVNVDVQTGEKSIINPGESFLDLTENEDDPAMKDDEDKVAKGVTDDTDNSEDSEVGNSKDKLNNMNVDDSMENEENDETIDSRGPPVPPAPAVTQLHNEEEDPFTDDTDSNFFTYFMLLLLVCVIAYVVYHNKSKMLALMLEGRRSSTNGRSGLSRRKHTAAYRKLDSNLEEAITSSANGRSTQVIY